MPAASRARDGNTTISPGTWAKIDSPHWLCQIAPPVQVAADRDPQHHRARDHAPFDRQRIVAASVLICVMAGQM